MYLHSRFLTMALVVLTVLAVGALPVDLSPRAGQMGPMVEPDGYHLTAQSGEMGPMIEPNGYYPTARTGEIMGPMVDLDSRYFATPEGELYIEIDCRAMTSSTTEMGPYIDPNGREAWIG